MYFLLLQLPMLQIWEKHEKSWFWFVLHAGSWLLQQVIQFNSVAITLFLISYRLYKINMDVQIAWVSGPTPDFLPFCVRYSVFVDFISYSILNCYNQLIRWIPLLYMKF